MSGSYNNDTTMGGEENRFKTTIWTEISHAKTLNEAHKKAAISNLAKRYWKPVYCYLRRKGLDNEAAKDITQSFFSEVVLGRSLMQKADSKKGRFRTFLLTALDRFSADVYEKQNAKKRSPVKPIISFEANELSAMVENHIELSPEEAFNYMWASDLINEVLNTLKNIYIESNKEKYWHVFNERVVKPVMDGGKAPSLADICVTHGIKNQANASDMIYRVKQEFRSAMRSYLRAYVDSDLEVEEEFNSIFEILSRRNTR